MVTLLTVGDRIRKQRELLGISQTELAEKIKISKQTLYKYETNIITNIPSDKLESIAKFLNVSPASLMGWDVPNLMEESFIFSKPTKIISCYNQLNDLGKHEAEKRVEELTYIPEYSAKPAHLMVDAAHEIENSSQDDKQYDEDIMDDENF